MADRPTKPYEIDDFLGNIREEVTDAVDFIGEFEDDFEQADRYFNGEVDLPEYKGRSRAVATLVRDSVRNLRPSIMRVLLSNRQKVVKYIPSNIHAAAVVEQQQAYVHQLFWASGGYRVLYEATDESLKHRFGPVKTYWDADPAPDYALITGLTLDEAMFLSEMPGVHILSLDPQEEPDDAPTSRGSDSELYDVEFERDAANGRICIEAVPYGEFFISRNARTVEGALTHGHRRSVTVSEAVEMGLDYEDWWDLDDFDPESAEVAGQSAERRGYEKQEEQDRGDELGHRFLLTEAYVWLDLEDTGFNQLYCVYLGGTGYELIDYERVSESPFDVICHDPKAFGVIGTSVADIMVQSQDVNTSLLRGMLDNVHMSNNPRLAGNPAMVNFDDVQRWDIGSPIRMKGQGTAIQVIAIPSQIQTTLPMLGWLEQDAQNKIGVTKAAQGLDPNAMQSTDKDAVRNTIQLSQGQVELAVRNCIETGIIPMFRKMLRLSIRHMDRQQTAILRGQVLPVDQLLLDPDCVAEPAVGLGSADDERRLMGLQMTLQHQMMAMQQFGAANPFVTLTHIYHTLEDLTQVYGLDNVSRYYAIVTPEREQQFAKKRAEEAAAAEAAGKGMDPAMALVQSEQIKSGTEKLKELMRARAKATELELKAIELDAKDDLERDRMAQDRVLTGGKILADTGLKVDENEIKREQAKDRGSLTAGATNGAK